MEQKDNKTLAQKIGSAFGTAIGITITVFAIALIAVLGFKLLIWLWLL